MTDIIDGEIVEQSNVPAVRDEPVSPTLFGTTDPVAVIARATDTAKPLAEVVRRQRLATMIQGREHVRVEGWTLLGSMLGVFPVCVWTRKLEDGWEARVEARTRDGAIIGAAEAECLRSESTWRSRDDYALRSMAQTRATSKALRQPLGFVMQLAGFEATPAEEMPHDEPAAVDGPADQVVLGFGKHRGETLGALAETDRGYVEWLADNAKDAPIRDAARAVLAGPPAADEDIPF